MKAERRLPATPDSVRAARRFVAEVLADVPPESLQRIELMISELATNCVLHVGGEFVVAVRRDDREVRIEVIDAGAGDVRVRSPRATDPHGRGLRIVAALADDWGVSPAKGRRTGKRVWLRIAVPHRATA